MPQKSDDVLSRDEIPYLGRSIAASRQEPTTIRVEGDGQDVSTMPVEREGE
jgi:hypothetical protein